jgi:uracil-DNA glycosylase
VTPNEGLAHLLREIRACRHCEAHLPLGPRPVLHISTTARVLIASQAPGTKVHQAGISFWDASGDRLRAWLGIDKALFYDESRIAILPMGLCYPGRLPAGGDAPPRPECAPKWRNRILAAMPDLRLTLLVGTYSQAEAARQEGWPKASMTERVRDHASYLPRYFPLPHPSWRTGAWERKNPWFITETLPALRSTFHAALSG